MRLRQSLFAVLTIILGFVASASLASAKSVEVTINKASQKMTVRVDGATEYVWLVSTGAASYETPSGQYKPFRLEEDHFSKEWDDAPMPHSIFFTPQGHAVHGSFSIKSLGRKASHGCVRLHPDNAAILFDLVQEAGLGNTKFIIKGGFFDFDNRDADLGSDGIEKRKSRPWFLRTATGVKSSKKPTERRSFFDVSNDIDKTTKKTTDKKLAAKKAADKKAADKKLADKKAADKKLAEKKLAEKNAKAKKLALKCTTKDGKKVCKKPNALFNSDNS
jgi:L,D-transpeptidase catalytic domain